MTKVDFYILPSADPSARLDFACKLTDKAWRMGHRIYLHCSDAAQRDISMRACGRSRVKPSCLTARLKASRKV